MFFSFQFTSEGLYLALVVGSSERGMFFSFQFTSEGLYLAPVLGTSYR